MELPPTDLSWFAENLRDSVQELIDAWGDSESVAARDEAPPELLREALGQLIDVLRAYEWNNNPALDAPADMVEELDISELGEYGLGMLAELSQLATDLAVEDLPEKLEQLALSLALWVIRQGGELGSIELVVNGLARLANHTLEQADLEQLFHTMGEILDMVPPITLDQETTSDPRELLLLNRAIVATRALSPQMMDIAFADVAEQLPESAPDFFREGMEQIRLRGYPPEVSAIIERYYLEWPSEKVLH